MSEYYVGQIFTDEYPAEAAEWCNQKQGTVDACYIDEIESADGHRKFEIKSCCITPEDVERLRKLARIDELQKYLDNTDWYVTRFSDTGEPMPEDVKKKRQEARDRISELRG